MRVAEIVQAQMLPNKLFLYFPINCLLLVSNARKIRIGAVRKPPMTWVITAIKFKGKDGISMAPAATRTLPT